LNARQQPTSSSNPTGNAFVCEETDLTSVHQAQRLAAPELNRVWRVKNLSKAHPYRLLLRLHHCAAELCGLYIHIYTRGPRSQEVCLTASSWSLPTCTALVAQVQRTALHANRFCTVECFAMLTGCAVCGMQWRGHCLPPAPGPGSMPPCPAREPSSAERHVHHEEPNRDATRGWAAVPGWDVRLPVQQR
jgi:hypothetical protein